MKVFLKPTSWKIIVAVVLYIPTIYGATFLLGSLITYVLSACSPSLGYNPAPNSLWCGPVNYLLSFLIIIFRIILDYILACTAVYLYTYYIRQRAQLEEKEKQKISQTTENEENHE